MSSCININSKEFKELQLRLNIGTPMLELVLYSILSLYGDWNVPDSTIDLYLQGDSVEFGSNSLALYEKEYKQPIEVSPEQYLSALQRAKKAFPERAISHYLLANGNYMIRVAKPLNAILQEAMKTNQGHLLINGKVSNLDQALYVQVRTPQFKRWFGDWEFDSNHASKIVDENGEPKVAWHSGASNIDEFKRDFDKTGIGRQFWGKGFYFSGEQSVNHWAEMYEKKTGKKALIYPVFLNMRNPSSSPIKSEITQSEYDGVIIEPQKTTEGNTDWMYIVGHPNQIKSATGNDSYSKDSNNIYENKEVHSNVEDAIITWATKLTDTFTHEPSQQEHTKKLVHRWNSNQGEAWVNHIPVMSKGEVVNDTSLSINSLDAIFKALNLSKAFLFTSTKNSTILSVNYQQLSDYIERNSQTTSLFGNTEEAKKVNSIINFLEGRLGVRVERVPISEEKAARLSGRKDLKNTNAFYTNKNGINTVYFIEGRRLNADIAAEEILHPLVASIQHTNSSMFKELLEDALKLFPKLHLEIRASYSENSSEATIQNELVTLALARAFVAERTKNPIATKAKDFIAKFGKWIASLFSKNLVLPFDNNKITIDNLAALINSEVELHYNKIPNLIFKNIEQNASIQLQENNNQENNLQDMNKQEQLKEEQDYLLNQIYTINEQYNRILENKALTSSDLSEVSDVIADLISSKIDELEAKREQVKELLLQRNPEDTRDVNSMSRFDLLHAVGIQYFLDLVKQDFVRNKRFATPENRVKITEVIKNWDYFITRVKSVISDTEGIHIGVGVSGTKEVRKDDTLIDQYDEDGSNVQDQVEDGQLSWQIENNTIDPITSMTQLVKLQLRGLYVLKDSGRKDENGNVIYDRVKTKWGTEAKVGHVKAAKCLLKWLNSTQSLNKMTEVLNSKANKNPWVTQLMPMLTDTTGKYTTEQCQFFSTFYRPFMKFSNVGTKGGKLVARQLNEHPFLTTTIKTIEASYKLGQHPLISSGLANGAKALNLHYTNLTTLFKDFDANKEAIYEGLRAVTKGLGFEINVAELKLDKEEVGEILDQLKIIDMMIDRNKNNSNYDPFAYGKGKDGIRSNLMRFFEKLTDQFEEEAVTSFYEGGKMRQSYLLPSYLSMFTNKFHLENEAFNRFLLSEFNTEFMRESLLDEYLTDEDLAIAVKKGWNIVWLQHMMSDAKKRLNFKCKTSITFNGSTYMKGMTKEEYALAMITEFFSENSKETDPLFLANFRVPIESNKPSAEYITFYARGGSFYKEDLIGDFLKVFSQELTRIKTVHLREKSRKLALEQLETRYKNGDITSQQYESLVYSINQQAITNFDTRGKSFIFLDFLNAEIEQGTKLGSLIEDAIEGKEVNPAELSSLAAEAIKNNIEARVQSTINSFKENGVFELCKIVDKIGNSNEAVQSKLELMLWNDAFASTQIMQLLISDPAFLKNTDDIQKRFAQVHASGTRANLAAVDFNGVEVSDGIHRSITLKDVEGFVSNIITNLSIVLDKKIETSKTDTERIAWEAFKDKLVGKDGLYRNGINLTDAQAYSCPTSYRKKALTFGMWSEEAEATYLKIKDGNYTYSDVVKVFQPFKPFVYGNSIEDTGINETGTMSKVRVPVQNKNAECLLVMADAIISDNNTGTPNLLRALFDIMEKSHYDSEGNYKQDGIDTVNFESAVKSGAQGRIDTQAYKDGINTVVDSNGNTKNVNISPEEAFKQQLRSLIYTTNPDGSTSYNRVTVKHLSFENYCMQQSVPEHFLDHSQLEGTQQRAILPSDLAKVDADGNTVMYKVGDKLMTAEEVRTRYDNLHAENIQKGIEEIEKLFMLNDSTPQQKKEALSKLLVEQFLKDGRYSGDMIYMVTLNKETGDFPISLEDPSIRTQVEQAINSIIKSRVNKLKAKGGPLVQMSNFGMSNKLRIKFLDKEGNLLLSREEFESQNPNESYSKYVSENQAGIAHFEVIAPAYTEAIFKEFTDKNGNVNVEALEMLHPDLLKMIGYRIPTEANYSIAPLKIVGFAPREMGDVIILPAEITLITGSDFDVDKEYCIRKTLDIIVKEKNEGKIVNSLVSYLGKGKNFKTRETIRMFADRFINDPYNKSLWLSEGFSEAQYREILKVFLDTKFAIRPATGVDANNNEIFDISYAILTSAQNVAKALKPGGFEDHKKYAYAAAAYRIAEVRDKYSFDSLLNMSNKELGKLIEGANKNLIFLDTQLDYYDHNNSANSLLGIFAVNNVSHAILVDDTIGVSLDSENIPTIAGFEFQSIMKLDPSRSTDGALIGETLGSGVGASADAAKDPLLALMNLNPKTINIYTTLIRLGMPNQIACLLMSSKVLGDAIIKSDAKTVKGEWSTPEAILRESLTEEAISKIGYRIDSPIFTEELTRDELIEGLYKDDVNLNLKIANVLVQLFNVSRKIRIADQITRFNSITSAVGPTFLDNTIFSWKKETLNSESQLVDMETKYPITAEDILDRHKMLNKFSYAYDLANEIVKHNMPLTKSFLEFTEDIASVPLTVNGYNPETYMSESILCDRYLMSKLREFYTSYLGIVTGLVNYSELNYLSAEFPKTLNAKKLEHKDNYLVQNLYLDIDSKSGFPLIGMNISKIEKTSKERVSSSWADLYKVDKEFATNLFKYSFFRGGLGFSPKTFMSVLPIEMKLELNGYTEIFKNDEAFDTDANLLYKQFVSNNYTDNKLAPIKKPMNIREDGTVIVLSEDKDAKSYKDLRFFKTKQGNSIKLYECVSGEEFGAIYREYREIPTLGAEGHFIEMSDSDIEKSIFDITMDLEDTGNLKLPTEVNDIPVHRLKTIIEAKNILNTVLSLGQLLDTIDRVSRLLDQAKAAFINRVSTRLQTVLKEKGFTAVDLNVFEEILKQLNLC